MNAELLAMLGGAGLPGAASSRREEEGKTILTFKAGRMDPVLQENGKYLITADPRRGQISLNYNLPSNSSSSAAGGTLKFEWKDRRTRTVVESFNIITEDRCTFVPIPTGRDGERVYLLQFGSNSSRRFFFWMQDKFEPDVDDKHCLDMNKFLSNVNECIIAAGGEPPADNSSNNAITSTSTTGGAGTTSTAATTTTTTTTNNESENAASKTSTASSSQQQQVEVLSNILENLGMPQPSNSSTNTTSSSSKNATDTNTASTGALTLADLQGAMAGLATNSPITASQQQQFQIGNNPTPPLTELAATDSISDSGILDNPGVVSHLMQYLPENQRTEDMLKENLRSPQVQQALHSLTLALVGESGDDGEGDGGAGNSMDSYHSIIANFQLNAEDGAAAMASGNPIQAFLDCLVASVKRDKEKKEAESQNTDDKKE